MGILNDVLQYKAQREAQANADINSIPQALMQFQAGRQQQQQNLLETLKIQSDLAKKGLQLIQGKNGQFDFQKRSDLVPEEDVLDQQLKRAQLGLYNQFLSTGQGNIPSQQPGASGFGTFFSGMSGGKPQLQSDTPVDVANRATTLRKEFNDLPLVKEYQTIKNQVSSMEGLLDKSKGNGESRLALDQGLITLFNKITDPNSVVRESEYERTPKNLSLVNRFNGALEKLEKGGAGLTQDDRESLLFGAKVIADQRGDIYNETLSNYENLSKQLKVDPKLVTSGYGKHSSFVNKGKSFNTPEEADNSGLPKGTPVKVGSRTYII